MKHTDQPPYADGGAADAEERSHASGGQAGGGSSGGAGVFIEGAIIVHKLRAMVRVGASKGVWTPYLRCWVSSTAVLLSSLEGFRLFSL